jgi:hypothetical protein
VLLAVVLVASVRGFALAGATSPDEARASLDFTVVSQTDDTLAFTYRVPSSNTVRYNTFRWIAPPDSTEAGVEMSVAGRERDRAGLADLLAQVSASFSPRQLRLVKLR